MTPTTLKSTIAALAAVAVISYAATKSNHSPSSATAVPPSVPTSAHQSTTAASRSLTSTAVASPDRKTLTGLELFRRPFPGGIGRSCATCHVPEENFTLKPARVERLLAQKPNDPLFNAIDADDPTATPLTFEHLKKGLVRVWITLPANMDQIDDAGVVVTAPDRKVFVWRAVPSVADSALTAPYQVDGREASLESQAQGAATAHSQVGTLPASELKRLASFQRGIFTSDRSRAVATALARGVSLDKIPEPEAKLVLTAAEARGRKVFKAVCASCHGGAAQTKIVDRSVHDQSFPALQPDGSVMYQVPATQPPTPMLLPQPTNEFLNIGTAYEIVQAKFDPADSHVYTKDLDFPEYRFRFYTDGTRTQAMVDLPPIPAPDFAIIEDADGNPIIGPNFGPQPYTPDPGRALITGNPYDFEAFDMPSLRGVSKTAPYFHNNGADTLEAMVQVYSDHLLSKWPSLTINNTPPEPDPDGELGPPEALSAQQKADLVKYLKRL